MAMRIMRSDRGTERHHERGFRSSSQRSDKVVPKRTTEQRQRKPSREPPIASPQRPLKHKQNACQTGRSS
jgi:hypothetical protein